MYRIERQHGEKRCVSRQLFSVMNFAVSRTESDGQFGTRFVIAHFRVVVRRVESPRRRAVVIAADV